MSIMPVDRWPDTDPLTFDLCIVGSGPAGLSLALEFEATSHRVVVLESGPADSFEAGGDIDRIESVGLRRAPQELVRCRGLGGTSALWSGRCGVFDPIDYAARPWVPGTGWPIGASDVAPYYDRAGRHLGLAPTYVEDWASAPLRERRRRQPFDPRLLQPVIWQFSLDAATDGAAVRDFVERGADGAENIGVLQHAGAPRPRHFGNAFRTVLQHSRNIVVLTEATATQVETTDDASRVEAVTVRSREGKDRRIVAPTVVLACGGIENARLLLASRSRDPNGVGNRHDQVGRHLADHALSRLAIYRGGGPAAFRHRLGNRYLKYGGRRHVFNVGVRLSPDVQRREGLLSSCVHVADFGANPAAVSHLGQAARSAKTRDYRNTARSLAEALRTPLPLARGLLDRYHFERPPLAPATETLIGCVVEQLPDPDSRVTLSSQRDGNGLPRARVDWRASELEYRTARRMWDILSREIAAAGYEPPQAEPWLAEDEAAWRAHLHDGAHPSCATRMSADPANGVVDANCRVHGVDGLFVAGSSVFATPGFMNPTQMIVALALRLADHLKQRLRVPSINASPRSEKEQALAKSPLRVGFIGAGDRVRRVYLPILRALAEEFEPVGFVTRSSDSAKQIEQETGAPGVTDVAQLVERSSPDLIIAAVSPDAIDDVAGRLVTVGLPVLLETPFTFNPRRGRKTLKAIETSQQIFAVAEQTPFLPAEQFKRHAIGLGLIGEVVSAFNDFAVFDYHGIAAVRAYMQGEKKELFATAVSATVPQPIAGQDTGAPHFEDVWLQGTVRYDDGSWVCHSFSPGYFNRPFRVPRSLRVYGTSGSIVDDHLYIDDGKGGMLAAPIVRVIEDGRLQAIEAESPMGPIRWNNPFAAHLLDDEQIAVATLLRRMAHAVRDGGDVPYSARRALEDVEFLAALRYSAERNGRPVSLPLSPTLERGRSVVGRAARRLVRRR